MWRQIWEVSRQMQRKDQEGICRHIFEKDLGVFGPGATSAEDFEDNCRWCLIQSFSLGVGLHSQGAALDNLCCVCALLFGPLLCCMVYPVLLCVLCSVDCCLFPVFHCIALHFIVLHCLSLCCTGALNADTFLWWNPATPGEPQLLPAFPSFFKFLSDICPLYTIFKTNF